jgi:hypothetical protein
LTYPLVRPIALACRLTALLAYGSRIELHTMKIRIAIATNPQGGEWVAYRTWNESPCRAAQAALETLQETVADPECAAPVLRWVEVEV